MIRIGLDDDIPEGAIVLCHDDAGIDCHFVGDEEADNHIESQGIRVAKINRNNAKRTRADVIKKITVTTVAGNTFDGDEISQGRMCRAIVVMDDIETVNWVLSDNTVIQATKAELTEALKLAGQSQANQWVIE